MLSFSVIIVSWDGLKLLKTFLPSVTETDYPECEIIIADNASTDGTKRWIKSHYPKVKVVSFGKNYGYCGGNNKAVPYASGDILIFLNNDVSVDRNWLKPIAEVFKNDDSVAAVQPKILSHKKPLFFEYAGAAGGFIDKYGYPFCRGRVFETVEKDTGQYDEDVDIFWASGAAMAVRKQVFEKAGGFDEDFEFHMEEIDLCWRLWNTGYRVRSCMKSVVYHLGGASLSRKSSRKMYYNYRNSLTMLWKNYSSSTLFARFVVRIYFDFIAAFRELFNGKVKNFSAIIKGHIHFWKRFGKIKHKRNKFQSKRKIADDPKTMFKKDIISVYFFKNKKKYSEIVNSKKSWQKLT